MRARGVRLDLFKERFWGQGDGFAKRFRAQEMVSGCVLGPRVRFGNRGWFCEGFRAQGLAWWVLWPRGWFVGRVLAQGMVLGWVLGPREWFWERSLRLIG